MRRGLIAGILLAVATTAGAADQPGTAIPPLPDGYELVEPPPAPGHWYDELDWPAGGGWEWLSLSSDESTVTFVSKRLSSRAGAKVAFWVRQEQRADESSPWAPSGKYRSLTQRYEVDCRESTLSSLSITFYASPNLEGEYRSYPAEKGTGVSSPVIPGTVGESILTWGCKNIPAK